MFGKLKDYETVAELRSSKVLEGHAMKVICTVDDAIVNLDDMEYVFRMLQTVAQAHSTRFPNFNPEFFLVFILLWTLFLRIYSVRPSVRLSVCPLLSLCNSTAKIERVILTRLFR